MPHSDASDLIDATAPLRRAAVANRPFHGLIDAALVPDVAAFEFDGALAESHAANAWTWMRRDLAPDLLVPEIAEDAEAGRQFLDAIIPDLVQRAKRATSEAAAELDTLRRLKGQLGGDDVLERLPVLYNILKCRGALEKAQSFGRAANTMTDETALGFALQSMPLSEPAVLAVLMQAAIAQVTNPARLTAAVVRLTGSASEIGLTKAGFAPMIDAILSHAQAQIPALKQYGAFADIDLTCRAIDRFHRLMRAVTGFVELGRLSRWSVICAGLTKTVSELIEPKLKDVAPDVNRALRRRDGVDRLDDDLLLSALNGCYLLAAVRDCRDSLAVNALFDQTWAQVGQSLEIHVNRNLEAFRNDPSDKIAGRRLDAAITMAELRFNPDYAEVLRRARDVAARRVI